MSSGHTGRGGRGNRRTRRGSQRQRGQEGQSGQSGQPRQNAAMLLVSHAGGQAPTPEDALDDLTDEDQEMEADDEVEETDAADMLEADTFEAEAVAVGEAGAAMGPDDVPEAQEREHSSGEGRGLEQGPGGTSVSHSREENAQAETPGQGGMLPSATGPRGAVPYAPGMRPRMAAQGNSGATNGGDAGGRGPEAPGPVPGSQAGPMPGRSSRFERDRDRGEHEPLRPEVRGDVGPLIDSLHEIFVQDRAVASRGGTTRCGICYLHYSLVELEYREEEGYYICGRCARALGRTELPMVRRQQRS